MTDQQKLFVWLTIFTVVGLCLFPPWQGKRQAEGDFQYASHRFLYTGPSASVLGNESYRAFSEKTQFGKRIDVGRLAIEILAMVAVGGLIFVALDFKQRSQRKKKCKRLHL